MQVSPISQYFQSRGEVACQLLTELNTDVKGYHVNEVRACFFCEELSLHLESQTTEHLLENNPEFFRGFTVVVATQVSETTLRRLAAHLFPLHIPLLVARVNGLFGTVRLVVDEHTGSCNQFF